jgi:hypothetical protein
MGLILQFNDVSLFIDFGLSLAALKQQSDACMKLGEIL